MSDSETSTKTNAAKRLLLAIQQMKLVPGVYQQQPNYNITRTGIDTLPIALKLAPDERISSRGWEFMRAYKVVTEMITDVRHEVEQIGFDEVDERFYLREVPKLADTLSPQSLSQGWNETIAKFTPEMIANLENLERTLNRASRERELTEGDFAPLLSSISEALIAIAGLNVEDVLKSFLTVQLSGIKLAIDEYKFRGVRGLEPAVAGFVGALAMSSARLNDVATNDPEDEPKIKRIFFVVKTATDVLNTAKSMVPVWHYLQHGIEGLVRLLNS